jgi:nitrate reductase gamma subunit
MYEFSRGPLVWIAFMVFFFGCLYRLVSMILLAKKDKVVHPYISFKFGMRSILHWMTPYASTNMRRRPFFTLLSFVFHICLIITPIIAVAHVMLWRESWGISWWSPPEYMTNVMTIIVVVVGILFLLRRFADPTVRYVSFLKEYLLLLLVIAPFVTALLAYYQIFNYEVIIIVHMWTGALWLMAIPFTWLSHMFFFPMTRAYMGSEFGFVRNARDW